MHVFDYQNITTLFLELELKQKMSLILSYLVYILYTFALVMVFVYSLAQLHLLVTYIKQSSKKDNSPVFSLDSDAETPFVTIQLPVYNEKYVMRRLLDCISKIDYPKHKLQIQVLDDSTDESVQLTADMVAELRKTGLDITQIRRGNRVHFKAGALKAGLETAKGDFIAIFDADFLPQPDWLKQTVGYFKDPKIGVVQTRWGHINRDYSMLTKVQAFMLDAHFTLEQSGRNLSGCFINFNGTAGIWRKACIIDAGNWSGDTLTEDLDLSYRAQLKGWKFKYLEDVVTPAELPVVVSAARSQQFRWNKGGAENFIKIFGKVAASKTVSLKTKLHSFFHLINSSMFFFLLAISVLSVPMLFIKDHFAEFALFHKINRFFFVSTIILFVANWVVYRKLHGNRFAIFVEYVQMFVAFFTIALGFSLHNTLAVAEAYAGKRSDFIRTPKFNISNLTDSWRGNQYLNAKLTATNFFEFLLFLYFGFGVVSGVLLRDYTMLPFHVMLFVGFGYITFKSLGDK